MQFKKKSKVTTEIPTASLPDIVFMLLLFFMVTTVLRRSVGLPDIELPVAKKIQKLEAKKNVTHIYANSIGEISIDDKLIRTANIRKVMYKKRIENPRTIASLKVDRNAPMYVVTDIQQELREAGVLPINYTAVYGS